MIFIDWQRNSENLCREIFEWISDIFQLVGMSEIQAKKSFSWYLPARTECNYKTEPFLLLCAKRGVLERNFCVQ